MRFPIRRSLGILAAILLALGLLVPAALAAPGAPGGSGHGLVVPTNRGLVRGKSAEGIDQWLGIPYAAPPVGALRWAAPRPAPRWAGIRQATSYGGRCAQLASGNGPRVDNEDCLYLNVYSPPGHHGRLPVLVMIHGGGLTTGAGDQHDGSLIVSTDHVVVVSINYRLGPFGFLNLPGLGTSALTDSGNFGLLDQETALRWVQRNIAGFGGDPREVTIDGESAGGLVGLRADDLSARARAVPERDHAERKLRHPDPFGRADREPRVRQAGWLPSVWNHWPGHRRGVPARPAREDAARRQYQLPAFVHLRRARAAGARGAGGRLR